jgi:hypothetical protein
LRRSSSKNRFAEAIGAVYFILMLRLYWPSEKNPSIINGTWKIPPVKLVK